MSADQALVVQKVDNAIQINLYLVDSVIGFPIYLSAA